MEIIFATSNRHKLSEAKGIIGKEVLLITPADLGIIESIPEDAPTLEENALFKARYLWERTGRDVFADDTGLEVEALNGAPGVMSARYASEDCDSGKNMQKLLKELKGISNRKARFRTVVALILNGDTHLFEGVVNGTILEGLSGTGGFGYDPLFLPDGYTKTLAELSYEEKNLISHRGIAMRKLSEFLKTIK
ncbi:MAG: non-canonical purine NTP pyrophosphatase, RdgB/HAM1 family [Bacteroidetes bacterium GWE2_39_28]|nr:MAG: non-canonical purine NTP pyrophosphatase, RdgB/HAM1 family [Bacteroidetes bacterium GWE2_39_28]OFY13595.1 MAG: non-canonical purine NTP pyrophosphatase, RdgB/HAM1 family [Bacteroidetes bacterium GWF2_39_10]OFZ08285.1 MAG: non-canonical purine NTP pyrophosphatase, RdgB/HAM1 family [Bacteroidetes bacterium RIFOXYB2_FULL_39_7]OFZ11753.1 MAG: non-canonical purine NTP pyrophosphatase, RdgB/HAM1 family [Bacteroidetes bacterium RIFOXYC2_FULL_39_11]HCT94939.1 non-canonical purine NTP pyrophosph